jgi:hypothetical protein
MFPKNAPGHAPERGIFRNILVYLALAHGEPSLTFLKNIFLDFFGADDV